MKRWFGVGVVLMTLSGCASQQTTLYQELGGQEGIEAITGNFIALVGEHEQIRPFFLNSNLDRFFDKFVEHMCEVSDGPCRYEGDSMQQIHIGMEIREAEFNYVVDILIEAMDQQGIPHPVQNRLLARLAPMRGDIIYR